jgi:hypothetical protein
VYHGKKAELGQKIFTFLFWNRLSLAVALWRCLKTLPSGLKATGDIVSVAVGLPSCRGPLQWIQTKQLPCSICQCWRSTFLAMSDRRLFPIWINDSRNGESAEGSFPP